MTMLDRRTLLVGTGWALATSLTPTAAFHEDPIDRAERLFKQVALESLGPEFIHAWSPVPSCPLQREAWIDRKLAWNGCHSIEWTVDLREGFFSLPDADVLQVLRVRRHFTLVEHGWSL